MKKYTIRPYYGYDCNSDSGFNNGTYLDTFIVEAESESEAACIAAERYYAEEFTERSDVPERCKAEVNGHWGDGTIYYEFDHIWYVGDEEFHEEPECDAECTYLYKYIDFNDVELMGELK